MERIFKILHFSVDYPYTNLYAQILTALSRFKLHQFVFVALKTYRVRDISFNLDDTIPNTKYLYAPLVSTLLRFLYFAKIKVIYEFVKKKYDWKAIDLIHSHYLFSDSGVAYLLNKEFNVPYITAVRNTDVNIFFKYFIHVRKYGVNILRNAEMIYFLSPAYKKHVIDTYIPIEYRDEIEKKSFVIPNGVNDFWLKNLMPLDTRKAPQKRVNFIFVGGLAKNKNIHKVINILLSLRKENVDARFDVIGEDFGYIKTLTKLFDKHKDFITYHGFINDKEKIKMLLQKADIFIMPSQYETFGLVYIEAMSQGLPVIYRHGQGIDGYFPDGEVGCSIEPSNITESIDKIKHIIENYSDISNNCIKNSSLFSWEKITENFFVHYNKIIK